AVVDDVATHARVARGVRHVRRLDEIATSQLGRVQLELAREQVHHPLDDEITHFASAAADEAGRNRVGVDEGRLRLERWQVVGTDAMTENVVALTGGWAGVRANVVLESDAESTQCAARPIGRELRLGGVAVGLAGGLRILSARGNP